MPHAEDVSYVETMICNCGTATDLAEITARVGRIAKHLNGGLCGESLRSAYFLLREATLSYAGIGTNYPDSVLDDAIDEFYEDDSPSTQAVNE